MALLLYEKQLSLQKDVPASGGDATWFDNRLVWAKFLDKSFVENAFPGRVAPFTVFPELLRVWMSILDGESQVERDLGFMRGFARAAKRASDELLENLLILKLSGPKTGDEVQGQFAVQCVELWRKIHRRLKFFVRKRRTQQPAAQRRQKLRQEAQGTFAQAKRGVLRASRLAKIPRRDDAKTAYGVSADFLKKPCGEVIHLGEEWQKFDSLTKDYRIKNRMFGNFARSAFPKFKLRQSTNDDHIRPDYSAARLLVYVPTYSSAACGALAAGYETRAGHHACRFAHVVIVDDLARLHSSDHADLEWVLHLLYIVARGLPVTTAACASSVSGDVKKMARTSFREHKPQMTRRVNFLIARQLHAEHPALAVALRAIEQMPSSAWSVKLTNDIEVSAAAASGAQVSAAAAASGAPSAVIARSAASGAVGSKKKTTTPTRRRPNAVAKSRGGRPVGAVKVSDVSVPDLATMLAWLRSNRRTVNANHTRMCWRRNLPSAI